MQNGILLIKKGIGVTSYDIIRALKKKLKPHKIGHAGTLDPFACGLLIIAINEGTKILPFIENEYKEYIAQLSFGEDTDTFDVTGKVTKKKAVKKHTNEEIEEVLQSFIGKINQTPPVYSAIKLNGKPLYQYARNGIDVAVKPRQQIIYDLKLISNDVNSIIFYVKCNKGTYIRSLGVDIAHRLKECGHLINLERIGIGDFKIAMAKKVNDLEPRHLINIIDALKIKHIEINSLKEVNNGAPIKLTSKEDLVLLTHKNVALAIYERNHSDMLYHCKRRFIYENI